MKESKQTAELHGKLPVMEAFYTIQGEGHFTGNPAYFVRLGGCDVGCVWCDVKDSWDALRWPLHSIDEIVGGAKKYKGKLVVVTGGEPLMYNLNALTDRLRAEGYHTNIETSGAHSLSGTWDWLCFSPKKFMQPKEEFYAAADELKVVVYNKSDFKWAEEHAAKVRPECLLYLQPEWDKSDKMLSQIIDYVKDNPRWKISLQTHKFMHIP
ncbi:7-carboxy-7-deazaguanine synthase QueE [Roseivirga sp. UBA1976]|uniref:7-carboxy-7-deazaguanine synthase QueE n=1 Tax=Roseivirga sp. UBA1976 TaxID=1947386 RepID=UPI00257EB667|nr:7-carboxy-7-deazaguanine synthase QueE [Roseivirga sp. UBA1976]|tara:strand:+ start:1108 stop:1737 length:630 start_codon:yes stop_codon:yes gene_type:complete